MTGDTRRLFLLAVSCALLLAPLPRASAQDDDVDYVCTKDGATRQIAVVHGSGYACRVEYTKSSGTSYPWNARNEADYCAPEAAGLAERLVGFGWNCEAAEDVRPFLEAAEDVRPFLLAQLERYASHVEALNTDERTCYFYPDEARYGNLCGDAHAEAAVVYTCDGAGGSWEQHLAVFIEVEEEPLLLEVGDSGSRQVAGYYIDDNRLTIEAGQSETGGDGAPSGESGTRTILCRPDAANLWELFEQD